MCHEQLQTKLGKLVYPTHLQMMGRTSMCILLQPPYHVGQVPLHATSSHHKRSLYEREDGRLDCQLLKVNLSPLVLSVKVLGKLRKFFDIFGINLNCWCLASKRIAHTLTNGPNFKI